MELVRKLQKPLKVFTSIDTTVFASVLVVVVFILWIAEAAKPMVTRGVSTDLPYMSHPVSMSGALRKEAMTITILRDGQVYFGNDPIWSDDLVQKIQDQLKDREVERKVYVVTDAASTLGHRYDGAGPGALRWNRPGCIPGGSAPGTNSYAVSVGSV